MIKSAKAYGMVPSDLLVVGAISEALEDMRRNPWLLDYCFNWFAADELTLKYYGDSEKQRAKDWFLKTKIWVTMSTRMDEPKFPLISVNLQSSIEDTATLGDVNYETIEDVEPTEISLTPQIVLGPFTPANFVSDTGVVTLPEGLTTETVFEGQVFVDSKSNTGYPILAIIDDTSFTIEEDVEANFINAYIAPIDSFYVASLQSCSFKQTYSIKCFAQNEPVYVTYLIAILRFILLRYKQTLLEGRGFDRSTIVTQGLYAANQILNVERSFGQDVTLTGYVREYWPELISSEFQGVKVSGLDIIGGSNTPLALIDEAAAQGWGTIDDEEEES